MAISAPAAYILTVGIVAPALIGVGVEQIPMHMFLFYYASLSPITPPVCPGCYVAAGIAKANWVKVAFVAVRLAAVAFLIPFFFIKNPVLLGIGAPLVEILYAAFTGLLGAITIAIGLFGFVTEKAFLPSRTLLFFSGILLLYPSWRTDLQGLLLGGLGLALALLANKAAVLLRKPKASFPK